MTFDTITIDMLDTVTGGYHDQPEPATTRSTPTCKVGEQHPKSFFERLADLGKRFGPWTRQFDR
jgi:hypothetical protein